MADQTHTATAAAAIGGDVTQSETRLLISANKVEGTSVFDPGGSRLGSIDAVMIDKRTGTVAYAVLSFGGFLGIGKSHYPLPWSQMRYDARQDGYVVAITEAQLKDAPRSDAASEMNWADPTWTGRIDRHYPVPATVSGGH